MNKATDNEMITVQEAAARKGVGVSTIYSAIERGNLTATLVFGRKVLQAADVDAYELATYDGKVRAKKRRGPGRSAKVGSRNQETSLEQAS